jgi:hypothetical protein
MFSDLDHELSIPRKSNAERSYQVDGLHKKKLLFKMVEVKTVKTIFIITSIANFYLENNQNKVTADLK